MISVTITLSLKHENSHRQDINEWCGYVSIKSYLQHGRPYLTTGHSLLTTELDQQKAVITEMVLPHHSSCWSVPVPLGNKAEDGCPGGQVVISSLTVLYCCSQGQPEKGTRGGATFQEEGGGRGGKTRMHGDKGNSVLWI